MTALRFVAILLMCGTAACSVPSTPPTEAILTAEFDNKTKAVTSVSIGLPSNELNAGAPTFSLKTQAGSVSTWYVTREYIDGAAATVELASHDTVDRPISSDFILASFIDKQSDLQHVLPRVSVSEIAVRPPVVANGDFTLWYGAIPGSWKTEGTPDTSFFIEPLSRPSSGLRLSVAAAPAAETTAVARMSLVQVVRLRKPVLKIKLRPYQECTIAPRSEGGGISALTGLGVTDTSGRQVIFCVTSGRRRFIRRIAGSETAIVYLPGRIGRWNNWTINLNSVWPRFLKGGDAAKGVDLKLIAEIDSIGSGVPWATVDVASIESN